MSYGDPPEGYAYIGPCRCGCGPHAYYRDRSGRVFHASQLYRVAPVIPIREDLTEELELLKEEKSLLEKKISDLENSLKEKQK